MDSSTYCYAQFLYHKNNFDIIICFSQKLSIKLMQLPYIKLFPFTRKTIIFIHSSRYFVGKLSTSYLNIFILLTIDHFVIFSDRYNQQLDKFIVLFVSVIIRKMMNKKPISDFIYKKENSSTNPVETEQPFNLEKERKNSGIRKQKLYQYLRNTYDPSFESNQNYSKYYKPNEDYIKKNADSEQNGYVTSNDSLANTYVKKYINKNVKTEQAEETAKEPKQKILATVKSHDDLKQTGLNLKTKLLDQLQELKKQRERRLYKKTSLNIEPQKQADKKKFTKKDYIEYYSPKVGGKASQNYKEKEQKFTEQKCMRKNSEQVINPEKIDIKKKYPEIFKNYSPKTNIVEKIKANFKANQCQSEIISNKITKNVSIDDFKLNKKLGEGKFGVVQRAVHKATKTLYAIKIVPKKILKEKSMIEQFILQLKIQSFANHENILKLYSFFDDVQNIYLILEYMEEGTLFKLLKYKMKLGENETAIYVRQVASSIKYLHEHSIAHRDLKPENIVMTNGICKLCDFGWSTICNQRRRTFCGTLEYAAPELLQGIQYDMSIDLWCLGVLAYELMVGYSPFHNASRTEVFRRIVNVNKQAIQYPKSLSKNAVSFIEYLLKKDPEQRMSIDRLLEHPFLKNIQ